MADANGEVSYGETFTYDFLTFQKTLLFSVLSFVVNSMQNVEQIQILTIRVPTRYRCDLNVPDISLTKCKNGVKALST